MAISQARMLELIRDCALAESNAATLVKDLILALRLAKRGDIRKDELPDILSTIVENYRPPILRAFYVEQAHFRKVEKYNEKKRRYMAGKRRMEGLAERGVYSQDPTPIVQLPRQYWQTLEDAAPKGDPAPPIDHLPRIDQYAGKTAPRDITPDLTDFDNTPPDMSKGVF